MTQTRLSFAAIASMVVFVAGCWGASIVLEGRLAAISPAPVDSGLRLWAHRGLGAPANTPQAALDALLAGYDGVELDARWYPGLGLRVGHDRLDAQAAANLPTLREVLVSTGGRLQYWIDLKGLSSDNVDDVAGALLRSLPQPQLARRLWVESKELESLARLRDRVNGIIAVAHSKPAQRYRPWPPYLFLLAGLVRHQISVVSLAYRDLSANLSTGFKPLTLLVYTVNDSSALAQLLVHGANIALTDHLLPEPLDDAQ